MTGPKQRLPPTPGPTRWTLFLCRFARRVRGSSETLIWIIWLRLIGIWRIRPRRHCFKLCFAAMPLVVLRHFCLPDANAQPTLPHTLYGINGKWVARICFYLFCGFRTWEFCGCTPSTSSRLRPPQSGQCSIPFGTLSVPAVTAPATQSGVELVVQQDLDA